MSAPELQNLLVKRIKTINNIEFLNAIKILMDMEKKTETYKLNSAEKQKIRIARQQIKSGKTHNNEDVINEIEQWLNEK